MKRLLVLTLVAIFSFGCSDEGVSRGGSPGVTVVIKGSSWDSDSRGFANIAGLSMAAGTEKAARRGSRISLDGRPEIYAISGQGGAFELTFTTSESNFRLVVEGDRFPRTITQPFEVPEEGGELDVGPVYAGRAEGPEHTWPLPMVATTLGYGSTHEMLADNKAAIRLLTYGSGAEGAPKWGFSLGPPVFSVVNKMIVLSVLSVLCLLNLALLLFYVLCLTFWCLRVLCLRVLRVWSFSRWLVFSVFSLSSSQSRCDIHLCWC